MLEISVKALQSKLYWILQWFSHYKKI